MSAWRFDGADVAHYQDEAGALINWDMLHGGSAGDMAATKLTQRNNYLDPTAARHRSEMQRVGFRRRGCYHWLSPVSEASVASQVTHYLNWLGVIGLGDFIMLDAEQAGITEPDAYEWVDRVMQARQRNVAVYGGISTGGGLIWRSQRLRDLGCCMWLAAYGFTPETLRAKLVASHADLPMHVTQYASSGPAPGVTGRCDLNQIHNFAVLDACCGYTSNSQEDDMKLVQTRMPNGALDPAVILLAGLDATWVQGSSSGLVACFGAIVEVPRSDLKAFYLDGTEPAVGAPGVSTLTLADFKGRRPAQAAVVANMPTKVTISSVPGVAPLS